MSHTSLLIARVVAPFALSALLLSACGGDDKKPKPTETASASPSASTSATGSASASATRTASVTGSAAGGGSATSSVTSSATASATAATGTATAQPTPVQPLLVAVRIAEHDENDGFDRIVFEWSAGPPVPAVSYVASAAQCGSGAAVNPAGDATLQARFSNAAAHNEQGQATFGSQNLPGPGKSIEQAIQICDFEGVVAWAIGVDDNRPFTVSTLSNPPRVVIDVAHDD